MMGEEEEGKEGEEAEETLGRVVDDGGSRDAFVCAEGAADV